ncbi:MAG: TolC family protein [Firmicutes bacterium]|nr:TolC family protein [Bacillota bacterium]
MKKLVLLLFSLALIIWSGAGAVLAAEPKTPELTVAQAIDMAVKYSPTLKSAQLTKDQAWQARQNAEDKNRYAFTPTAGVASIDASVELAFSQLMQASNNYLTQGKVLDATTKSVKLNAYDYYLNVLIAQQSLQSAQKTLAKDQMAEGLAKVKASVGVIAQPELIAVQNTTANSTAVVQQAQQSLDKAYVTFNSAIGLQPEDRPVLTEQFSFTSFTVPNLTAEASRAETSSTTVWQLEQTVYLQQMNMSYINYGPTGALQNYNVQKFNVDIAKSGLAAGRQAVRDSVFTLYNDIQTNEQVYSQAQAAVKTATENLRVAQVKYKVGMATKLDVTVSETALASAQANLTNLIYQHAVLVANFNNLTGKSFV